MKLIIDIGNTNIHCAIFNNEQLIKSSLLNKDILEYAMEYNCKVYVISVNKDNSIKAEKILNQYFENIMYLNKRENIIKTNYSIKDIGIDRYVNIVYAIYSNMFPILIMDLGTADTFDYIDSNGKHIGGFIRPGLTVMFESLLNNTDIKDIEFQYNDTVIGENTKQAINTGIITLWISGLINSIAMADRLINTENTIITGGNGKRAKDFIKQSKYDTHFTLRAINHYAKNFQ